MSDHSSVLPGRTSIPAAWGRAVAAAGVSLLAATAGLVAWRRASGALTYPLTPSRLIAAVVCIALLAVGVRAIWRLVDARRGVGLPMLLTSLSVVILVFGLCLPGTAPLGWFAAGAVLVAEELWAWSGWRRPTSLSPPEAAHDRCNEPEACLSDGVSTEVSEELPSEEVLQQLTRSCTADGAEEISGFLRMPFPTGQRTGNLHVAFCPSFVSTPDVLVEQIDGPEARVKLAQVLAYGARIDLKLAHAFQEPTSVLLQISARAAKEQA